MQLIYLAGPYRAKTYLGVLINIVRAYRVAKRLWREGYAVICPHTNTFWMSEPPRPLPAECFLQGDLEMVKGCDAVLLMPRWMHSAGSIGEKEFADKRGIPVFYSVEGLKEWSSKGGKQ